MDVKIIPLIISLGLLFIFVAPIPMGIFNIGNAVGILVSGAMSLVFLFWRPFTNLIKNLWDKSAGKIFISIFSVFLAVCVILAVVISVFMVKSADDPPPDENTTLVVLGCKVKNGRPSLMLKRRLDCAYEYLSEHNTVNVIVSGGQGSDEVMSEAQCMREYLTEKGISPERIFMEDQSTSTEENLKFSQEIINRERLPEKITLVTDAFHQCRAEMLAKNIGIDPYNISGYTSWYIVPVYWVREWFGIMYYSVADN
ncbi:MAG: YdcF family protein [Ruminococcus flavefaciens]|nr:YdcF family protein [Ruminococcus flavefaciens]